MAARFCTNCGARLDDGARFCTACGTAVEIEDVDPLSVVGEGAPAPLDDAPVPADDGWAANASAVPQLTQTTRMPSVPTDPATGTQTFPPATDGTSGTGVPPQRKSVSVPVAVAIMAAAVAIGGLTGFVVLPRVMGGAQTEVPASNEARADKDAQDAQGEKDGQDAAGERAGGDDASAKDAADAAANAAAQAREQEKAELQAYYDKLDGLHQQIRGCATAFNNTYLNADLGTRQANLQSARDVMSAVDSNRSAVQGMTVASDSPYYGNYTDICTLYDDLHMRISVIVESWERDVTFSDPNGHQDYITEPIARDNIGAINKYLTDYQNRYPNARP